MYESQLRALHDPTNTPEWYSQQTALWDSQKNSLTKGLEDKTREVEELTAKCNFLTEQIEKLNGIITTQKEQIQRAKDMQLSEADSDELIGQLRAEISEVKRAGNCPGGRSRLFRPSGGSSSIAGQYHL